MEKKRSEEKKAQTKTKLKENIKTAEYFFLNQKQVRENNNNETSKKNNNKHSARTLCLQYKQFVSILSDTIFDFQSDQFHNPFQMVILEQFLWSNDFYGKKSANMKAATHYKCAAIQKPTKSNEISTFAVQWSKYRPILRSIMVEKE